MLLVARGSWIFVRGSNDSELSPPAQKSDTEQAKANGKPARREQESKGEKRATV